MNELPINGDLSSGDCATQGTGAMSFLPDGIVTSFVPQNITENSSSLLDENRKQDTSKPYRIIFRGDLIHE